MPHSASQAFVRELDKKLWTAADKLRSNLDAAVYKHAVLGLIFLKYVSDSFAQRQAEIEEQLRDPESDFHLSPADYGTFAKYEEAIAAELEERDYYIEKNVFWVPALARWKTLQYSAKLPAGTEISGEHTRLACSDGRPANRFSSSKPYKITSTGKLIDDALEAVEKENPNGAERHRRPSNVARRVRAGTRIKLKNVLNKNYTQLQIDPANLAGLIDLIATIPFQHADRNPSRRISAHRNLSRHSAARRNWPRHSAASTGLAPNGSMALLLANGSMSSNSSGEGDIRRSLIEADRVETAPRVCAPPKRTTFSVWKKTANGTARNVSSMRWRWSCWNGCCKTRSGPRRGRIWCRRRNTATACWKRCGSITTG